MVDLIGHLGGGWLVAHESDLIGVLHLDFLVKLLGINRKCQELVSEDVCPLKQIQIGLESAEQSLLNPECHLRTTRVG